MKQEDIPFLLKNHFDPVHNAFMHRDKPFDSPLSRTLALLLSQGRAPANPTIEKRLNDLPPGDMEEAFLPDIAAAILASSVFFQGVPKRSALALRNFLQAIAAESLAFEELSHCSAETALEEFLRIKGLGPDTAESILLYALDIPFIPVNTGLYRIANRHGGIPEVVEREELRDWYQGFFPDTLEEMRQTHTHLITVAKLHCKAAKALCAGCPLKDML